MRTTPTRVGISRALTLSLAGFLAAFNAAAWGAVSLTGQLDPNNPQDVFVYAFTLSAPATVAIQTCGNGGTSNAPGGTNAQGAVIAAGGVDPLRHLSRRQCPGLSKASIVCVLLDQGR